MTRMSSFPIIVLDMTGDLVMPLFTASLDISLVRVEDAFLTGYCARRVGGVHKVN